MFIITLTEHSTIGSWYNNLPIGFCIQVDSFKLINDRGENQIYFTLNNIINKNEFTKHYPINTYTIGYYIEENHATICSKNDLSFLLSEISKELLE
jgi:hypothetical protein